MKDRHILHFQKIKMKLFCRDQILFTALLAVGHTDIYLPNHLTDEN